MIIFDLILLLILGGFVLYGLWFGLIHTLGVLVGTIAGAFLAARWYEPVASWTSFLFGGHENLAKVVCFLILFVIINRLVGLIFWLVDKIFSFLKIIPFLSTINRLIGAVFGFLEGTLVLGLTLYVAERYPLGDWFINSLADSKIAHYFITVGKILTPLLPEILKQIKALI
ncbi:CvpA family protein [Candidatus Falkowbacteria bacterium]|nr:CvpA family protein [Candidatus Falkowbacteria bacterium]